MLSGDIDQYQSAILTAYQLKEQYGFEDQMEQQFENANKRLTSMFSSQNEESLDLDHLLELPEINDFFMAAKESGSLAMSQEEFNHHLEKLEPDELPDTLKPLFDQAVDQLKSLSDTEQVSFADIIGGIAGMFEKTDE